MLNHTHIGNDHETLVSTNMATRVAQLAPALGAMIFGLTIIFLTALAPVQAIHNATHDTRHAFVVPCH